MEDPTPNPTQAEYHAQQTARRSIKYAAAAGFAFGAIKALVQCYELPDDVAAALEDAKGTLQEMIEAAEY